jgi:hypothetical protein
VLRLRHRFGPHPGRAGGGVAPRPLGAWSFACAESRPPGGALHEIDPRVAFPGVTCL